MRGVQLEHLRVERWRGSTGVVMEGLLQAALAMWLCKVGFSILCLPTLRGSLSSISLCCGCLLLLTDLAITLFLAVLWLAEPWLPPSPVSTNNIALRFLLFLTHTYGHVMLLFVPLVTVEMVFHLHRPLLRGVEGRGNGGMELQTRKGENGGKDLDTKGGEDRAPLYPEKRETNSSRETSPEAPIVRSEQNQNWDTSTAATLSHVVCVLSCLLAWCVSGLHTLHHRDLDAATVELCLEEDTGGTGCGSCGGGGGGSLWWCLPSLLSTTAVWPHFSKSCWGLPAAAVLLELCGSLRLIHILSARSDVGCPEKATPSPEEEEEEKEKEEEKESAVIQVPKQTAPVGPGSLTLLYEDQTADTDVHGQRLTRHAMLRAAVNPTVTAQSLFVDSETTGDRCCVPSAEVRQGDSERHRPPPPPPPPPRLMDVQRCLSSRRLMPSEWSLSGDERSCRQIQSQRPPVPAQKPQQSTSEMRYKSTVTPSDRGSQLDPQQLCSLSRAFPGESPSPRGLLIAGLAWGIFVCLFPVVLGFSVLLLRHTETLLLFGLKVLVRPPSQDKHTEST